MRLGHASSLYPVTDILARDLDAADPLARFRDRFVIEDELIYLDGNSLGRLPLSTRERLHRAIGEWGTDLIRGWDRWITLSREVGDVLATGVLDATPGEVVLSDSTSVNLYKLAAAACAARPGRRVIVTDDDNFPTDRYILQGLVEARGMELRVLKTDIDLGVSAEAVREALDPDVALVSLSHVAYRSGAVADLPAITAAAHQAGALALWDLSHSAGAVRVPLRSAGADLAVGCTYKHLNGGPGAPAFLYVRADLQAELRQPIWGWFGQRDQFDMGVEYDPVESIDRFQVGTPPVLGAYAALEGARLTAEAGIDAVAAKGAALGAYAIELCDTWLAPYGVVVASPRADARRGAHVTLRHPRAWQLSQALRAAGVIPDFRTPDRLRLGFGALYTRFVDVYAGLARLRDILTADSHLAFPERHARVT
ncbi:kynureninase [Phytohabitans rumicis]|uniref:Kynureninase n=1 Tax=Phytohabitans rumicis TaxID=1076125 RepID=A0A6V8LA98_9ACTN|nr:kynureninase [Phytohabitans rumicis]